MASDTRDLVLYDLLPAVYRQLDAEQREPLRALLRIIAEQADLVDNDIRRLWANFFIETCDPWVIPYIGDLVGSTPLFDASRVRQPDTARDLFEDLIGPRLIPQVALRGRADVAKTIYYRRRKGTLPMLEELARDVTGWGAHAVEFFELLGWTQCVRNHLRMHSPRTPDIRRVEAIDRVDGPFELPPWPDLYPDETAALTYRRELAISHTADVRPIGQLAGRHNIKNVGFFLWRLGSYQAEQVVARPVAAAAGDFRFHFSPLGNPAPLFTRWRREGDEAGLASEFHLPGPIRPAALYEDLERHGPGLPDFTDFYGLFDRFAGMEQPPDASLMIFRDGVPIRPEQVRCMDLSNWARPASQVVGVDVRLGRMSFGVTPAGASWAPAQGADVYYHYGFSADLGGGPYPRRPWLVEPTLPDLSITVDKSGAVPGSVTTITDALLRWAAGPNPKPNTVVTIVDNRSYDESIAIEPADGRWLVLQAADGARPHVRTGPFGLRITGNHPESSVTLSGLLLEGWVDVIGSLGELRILHSTLVPGRELTVDGGPATTAPSLRVAAGAAPNLRNTRLHVKIAFSITGPLRIPAHATRLSVLDSIVDGVQPAPERPRVAALCAPGTVRQAGPPTWLERVTVLGPLFAKELPFASEVIFADRVTVDRLQEGCVRFSFVPDGSTTPQRYRCQPELAIAMELEQAEAAAKASGTPLTPAQRAGVTTRIKRELLPTFSSTRYGQQAYAQLHIACPRPIQTGAEDGSEMGAFCHLKQPQREANLRLRLEEYLPFGLEPGIIYVT